jgi:hypothetical protein
MAYPETTAFADMPFDEAIRQLASVYADERVFQKSAREKLAAPEWLTSIGSTVINDPVARNALVGSAVGAVGGAGAHAFSQPKGKKSKGLLSQALYGGLAGGAIGAGTGMVQSTSQGQNPGLNAGGRGNSMVDAKALAKNPKLLQEIRQLSSSTNSFEDLIYGAANRGYSFMRENLPISTFAMPVYGAMALYNNTRHLPALGYKYIEKPLSPILNPVLNAVGLGSITGRRGVFDLTKAEDVKGMHKRVNPGVLKSGLRQLVATNPEYAKYKPVIERILGRSDVDTLLSKAQNPGDTSLYKQLHGASKLTGDARAKVLKQLGMTEEQIKHFRSGELSGTFRPETDKGLASQLKALRNDAKADPQAIKRLEQLIIDSTKRRRLPLHSGLLDAAASEGLKGTMTADARTTAPLVKTKGIFGEMKAVPQGVSGAKRHLMALAAIPTVEYGLKSLLSGAANERTLQQRLQELKGGGQQ